MSDINLCNIHKWQGYGNCPDCPALDGDLGNRLQEAHYEIERLSSENKRIRDALKIERNLIDENERLTCENSKLNEQLDHVDMREIEAYEAGWHEGVEGDSGDWPEGWKRYLKEPVSEGQTP